MREEKIYQIRLQKNLTSLYYNKNSIQSWKPKKRKTQGGNNL